MKRTEEKQGTLRWDKLDNTAHVFPVIAGSEMTNVYRISVVLKEEVQQDLLQQALDIVSVSYTHLTLPTNSLV